ncbi:MAG TPA: phage minor head protein [Fibrobacteria bacterium]|nr:phage minor head protein [Fibrobacteria bacterium]
MPDPIRPTLSFTALQMPFEQAVRNLEARIPGGISAEGLAAIQAGAKPRTSAHWNWHDTLAHQHAESFVIAKMTQANMLTYMHESLVRAQREGWSFNRWNREMVPQLQRDGWWGKKEQLNPKTGKMEMVQLGSPARMRTIYNTQMRTAMMAAHYNNLMAARELRPLWRYVAVLDKKTRPSHGALSNLVFRWDHPFWNSHFPPNGWGCRCTVVSETERSLGRLTSEIKRRNENLMPGQAAENAPEMVDASEMPTMSTDILPHSGPLPKGVHRKEVPVATFRGVRPDPGWSYNPGQRLWSQETMLASRIRTMPPKLAESMLNAMAKSNYSQWSAFLETARQQVGLTKGVQYPSGAKAALLFAIHWMDSDLLGVLRKSLGTQLEPILSTDAESAFHGIRPAKNTRQASGSRLVPLEAYQALPKHLQSASVFLDAEEAGVVVFASPLENQGGNLMKTVFRLDPETNTLKLVTTGQVKSNAFADTRRWELVRGNR